jgi:ribosomal protein L11 methyltransferase
MPRTQPTFLWQRAVTPRWLEQNEERLQLATGGTFAVVERAKHRRILVQACCTGRAAAHDMRAAFGGTIEELGRDWLARFTNTQPLKPLRIGKRLLVTTDEQQHGPATLCIPAGAAFGTGDHATTAMSLRMLERVTRQFTDGWRMLDAGTGSGILALAGKRFGAAAVSAIDNDPLAVSTARRNATLNSVTRVKFTCGDVHDSPPGPFEIITANLYSELLEAVLPRFAASLAPGARLILSGVMRDQEPKLIRALRRNRFRVVEARRRGKWVALLAEQRQKRS